MATLRSRFFHGKGAFPLPYSFPNMVSNNHWKEVQKNGNRRFQSGPFPLYELSKDREEQSKHNVPCSLISKEPFTTNQHVYLTSASKFLISLKITILFSKWFCFLIFFSLKNVFVGARQMVHKLRSPSPTALPGEPKLYPQHVQGDCRTQPQQTQQRPECQ